MAGASFFASAKNGVWPGRQSRFGENWILAGASISLRRKLNFGRGVFFALAKTGFRQARWFRLSENWILAGSSFALRRELVFVKNVGVAAAKIGFWHGLSLVHASARTGFGQGPRLRLGQNWILAGASVSPTGALEFGKKHGACFCENWILAAVVFGPVVVGFW